jgi:hypothetical protein
LLEKEPSQSAANPDGQQRDAMCGMIAFAKKNHTRLVAVAAKPLIHEGCM